MRFFVSGIEWAPPLEDDLREEKKKIDAAVQAALGSVADGMKDALERHIQTDVYDAYEPEVYLRRSENRALGTPLIDMEANVSSVQAGNALSFEYLPTGEHTVKRWATADGDALIRRIETGNPPYDFKDPGNRPFWENFCNEMIVGGGLYDFFARAMAEAGYLVTPEGGGVEADGNDGEY